MSKTAYNMKVKRKSLFYLSLNIFVILFIIYSIYSPKDPSISKKKFSSGFFSDTKSETKVKWSKYQIYSGEKLLTSTSGSILKYPSDIIIITETPIPTVTSLPSLTPTGTPMPKPTILASDELEKLFTHYSEHYAIDKENLKRIAYCESKFNAGAVNGLYGGMFQFSSRSWQVTRQRMGQDPNPNLRFNAEESIKTASFKIANGGISAWPNCSK